MENFDIDLENTLRVVSIFAKIAFSCRTVAEVQRDFMVSDLQKCTSVNCWQGGYSWEFLVRVCRPVLHILALFQTRKCHFPDPFSDQTSKIHTRLRTWPLGRNYVIIT